MDANPRRHWLAAAAQKGAAALRARLAAILRVPERRAPLAIVAVALVLRLDLIDVIGLDAVGAFRLATARSLVTDTRAPLARPDLDPLGAVEPPLYTYFLAAVALITPDPRAVVVMQALIDALAAAGLYLVVARYFGRLPAVTAAMLWAANPLGVALARRLDPLTLVAPLGVGSVAGLLGGVVRGNRWGWTLAVAAAGMAAATTVAAWAMIPGIALVVFLYRRRVSWPHLVLGVCCALLLLTPFLYLQNLERFAGLHAAVRLWAQDGFIHHSVGTVLGAARDGLSILALGDVPPTALERLSPQARHRLMVMTAAGGWLACLGMLALWPLALRAWAHWKERVPPGSHAVVGVYAWSGLAALAMMPVELNAHHLTFLRPVAIISLALVADYAAGRWAAQRGLSRWLVPGSTLLTILLLGLSLGWQACANTYGHRLLVRYDASPTYGLPYRFWRRTADVVRREAAAVGARQVWVLGGENPDLTPLSVLLGERPRQVPLGDGALALPAGRPGIYLRLRDATGPQEPHTDIPGQPAGLVISPGRAYEAELRVAAPQPPDAVLDAIDTEVTAHLDGGLTLLGYDWPSTSLPANSVCLHTYWTFLEPATNGAAPETRLSVQLITDQGHPVAGDRGFGLHARYWAEGYLLRQTYTLPLPTGLPAGDYYLRFQLARLFDGQHHTSDVVVGPVSLGGEIP